MTFSNKLITLGRGRVSHARKMPDGEISIVISRGDALVQKRIAVGGTLPEFGSGRVVSYADECFMLDGGRLERKGNYYYAPD